MSLDSLRILIVMANNIGDDARDQDVFNFEDESDDEFGLPEFRIHLADSLTPAVLRDWTAADFASIYVRFRPHLERHAKKFLRNPSQVEEVVQEAFLYLMTTLPELDSELGVLRFLKWKTRLLALDVIRANSKVTLAPIEESPDLASNDPELSQDLERAEDAGIVALALSKIQPRHREAIIATLYEEKSAEVVAAQMGLSENAFRQLLFRARSAFRKALVGEAETKGKSISEILSIAARKAAAESGKYISAAGAFLLVLAVSIGVLPNLSAPVQEQVISGPTSAPTEEAETAAEPAEEPEPVAETVPAENETVVTETPSEPEAVETETVSVEVPQTQPAVVPATQLAAIEVDPEREVLEGFVAEFLTREALAEITAGDTTRQLAVNAGTATLTNGTGLTASVAYDSSTEQGIQHVSFLLEVDGIEFAVAPERWLSEKTTELNGNTVLTYVATDLLLGDITGNFGYIVVDKTPIYDAAARLRLVIDSQGNLISSNFSVS
ncbi:MAG: sigma-70 family RNA polymerase sigma factor, partial [Actinobacteria bacterium]|nr:sigma-70 family RNA polymerase sigma factor [Actinomycetota bacterium]